MATVTHNNEVEEADSIGLSEKGDHSTDKVILKPRFYYSDKLGEPEYVLDPKDLDGCFNPCPDKMGAKIRRVDEHTIVKYGEHVRLAEAEAMHMAATQTSITVPKLHGAYVLDGITYIIMSYERGMHLDFYWDRSSEPERENVIAQLKDYVSQMRRIKGDWIGGVDGSHCLDGIFDWTYGDDTKTYGPFKSEAAFNEGIVEALNSCSPKGLRPGPETTPYNLGWKQDQLARSFKDHEIVFTHADLIPANILVRDDGAVVLLDWGLAGFWPEYWEFYRATWMGTWRPDYIRQVERYIPPFYMEAFVMRKIYDIILG